MRIALDLRRVMNPGIGRYMQGLANALLALNSEHDFLWLLPQGMPEVVVETGGRAEKIYCSSPYYSIREQLELPRILRARKADLLHSPHFVLPLMSACPAVVTLHDVIYLACKTDLPSPIGRAYYRKMMAAAARKAVRIITVSEFSKADIVRHLAIDPGKVDVIYPGISQVFRARVDPWDLEEAKRKHSIRGEFILFAGIYKPRKNHATLLRAFQRLRATGLAAQLVIAGPMSGGEAELKGLARELGIAESVQFTGYVDDSELAALYSLARVYACPSLYEGFGFTVVEAMACSAPVVCSRETSLPEVASEAALYADARDPEDLAQTLGRVFSDHDLRAEMIRKGHENCRRFDWRNAAVHTLAVYEQSKSKEMQRMVCA